MEELILNLKKQIIEILNLKHLKPEDIASDKPLFGDGLGLDSIDALELIVLLQHQYNIRITGSPGRPQDFQIREHDGRLYCGSPKTLTL